MWAKNLAPEVDIHCHILPDVDDGPSQLETSLAMAAIAEDDGIKTIIATPHTDGIRVNPGTVLHSVNAFNQQLAARDLSIKVIPGFEIPYHLSETLSTSCTLGASSYILVEFPPRFIPGDAAVTINQLITKGLQPVIAHPERNLGAIENPGSLEDLLDAGAFLQLTAASITGELGPDIERCAHHLLKENMVHFVATDSHSPAFRRPVLSRAGKTVVKLIGWDLAEKIFIHNPGRIIQSHDNNFVASAQ